MIGLRPVLTKRYTFYDFNIRGKLSVMIRRCTMYMVCQYGLNPFVFHRLLVLSGIEATLEKSLIWSVKRKRFQI